jgi:chromosome segregation ATPase
MTAQIEQLQGQLQQTLTYVAENQKAMDGVDSVLRENKTLKEMLAALYGESAEKINAANVAIEASNRQIMQDKAQIDDMTADAGAMAVEIARARGIISGGGGRNAMPRM